MLLKILFIYLWLFAKKTLKRISKTLQNKTSGASVVQNFNKKKTIHAYLVEIIIGFISSNLCTYLMQTSSIPHLYICFGLCWHQSPKRSLKGNRSLRRRQGFHSTPSNYSSFAIALHRSPIWYNLHFYIIY